MATSSGQFDWLDTLLVVMRRRLLQVARLKVRVTSSVLGPESQQSLRGLKADFNQISGAADKHLERALCGFALDLSALIHQFVDIKILEDKTSPS